MLNFDTVCLHLDGQTLTEGFHISNRFRDGLIGIVCALKEHDAFPFRFEQLMLQFFDR